MLAEDMMTQELPGSEPRNKPSSRIVVVGVGNLLLKDEGIGIHTVKSLQEIDLPQDVQIIDGGTSPDLITYTKAVDKLIIIDAAKAGGEPGTIYRFLPWDLSGGKGTLVSAHELGVAQNLKLMSLMGNEPAEIIIIGIEPKEIAWGTELSAELQQKVPEIIRIVLKEIGLD
jgi:hydrogenase maturation protease